MAEIDLDELEKLGANYEQATPGCGEIHAYGELADALVDKSADLIAAARERDALAVRVKAAETAVKVCQNAARMLDASRQAVIRNLQKSARQEHVAIATLDSEREANARLTDELDALRALLVRAGEVLELAENLMRAITGNEPDDLIADGGITVWHGIVVGAQNWLNIQWPKVEDLAARATQTDTTDTEAGI